MRANSGNTGSEGSSARSFFNLFSSVQSVLNPRKRVSFHFVVTLVAY